jgi:membrane-associated phospholipid phosphatase
VVVSLMSCSSLLIKFKLKQFQNVLFKWCLFAFLTIAIQWLVISTCKSNLPRERFLHLVGNESKFKPWYSLIWNKSDGSGFNYSSFPSGHTNWAITLILFYPLIYLLAPKKQWLHIIVICFIGIMVMLTMFARIQAAYHYLSDTAMSVFIGTICSTSIYICFYKWWQLPFFKN